MADPNSQACLKVDLEIVLDDFTIKVEFQASEKRLVLFGPSGAGKSTLLKTLAGLTKARRGQIQLNDRYLYDSNTGISLPPQARRIGYMPQQYALFPHLSIAQNIAYGIPASKRSEHERIIDRWITLMRLENQADRKPGEVSGGQQQRAALARAMASEPELLLMDEPFAALDQVLRTHLREEIREVSEKFRIPMIIVTHDPVEAYSIGDHVIVLQEGEIVQRGEREQVFRSPETPDLARLLGMSNIYSGEIRGSSGKRRELKLFDQNIWIDVDGKYRQGDVQVGFRPEAVELVFQEKGEVEGLTLSGRILDILPSGYDHLLYLQLEQTHQDTPVLEALISHRVYLDFMPSIKTEWQLFIRAEDLHIFPLLNDSSLS